MTHESRQGGFLQIGEAAERTELTQRTLRYYEEKGLLQPPTRMEGGFRLYSPADLERLERIKQFKDLLGFSLADIKEMLDAEDIRLQIRSEWRKDAQAAEKAAQIRVAREQTLKQLALIDQKMTKMASLRDHLAERMQKYDQWLLQWSETSERETSGVE
ncbi:MAG: MerR family transcriptional regulator [Dehalococcoidia bacterium]|nr:MerR family transcriptional regulator [Dehalococcoidia bacterium]